MAGQTGFKAGASDPRGITHIGHRDQLVDFLAGDRHGPRSRSSTAAKDASPSRSSAPSTGRPQTGQVITLPLDDGQDAARIEPGSAAAFCDPHVIKIGA